MDEISVTTAIVVGANSITAIVSAALFLLVLWQNPRHLTNQLFAFSTLALTGFCITNSLGRLVDTLQLDANTVFYTSNTFYGAFIFGLLVFTLRFAPIPRGRATQATIAIILIGLILGGLMWNGHMDDGYKPAPDSSGDYQTSFTALGFLMASVIFGTLIATAVILYWYRHYTPRARLLWIAPLLVVAGVLWIVLIWPSLRLPINTFTLAAATLILGRAVLLEQTFDPLAHYSAELTAKNRELEEANRLKRQFMANMSHELRTPLNSIIGYAELTLHGADKQLNDKQRDRLEKVIRNGRHLLGLINDILDLGNIEAGRLVLHPETVDTVALLDQVIGVIEPGISSRSLEIIRDYAAAPAIYVDRVRARQIFTNILDNAIKFTQQGHIRIKVSGERQVVNFEIEDTGIGIPEDKLPLVFEEFRQVDSTSTRQYGGTGLGMPITKRLIEMSRGTIDLESTENRGTTVHICLPRADAAQRLHHPPPDATAHIINVLIIDDEAEARTLLYDTLRTAHPDYHVYTADSGREGIEAAQRIQPDIITLDIMMPNMDGWQVLKRLRS
ncbi:MAG: response regulator, partial [Chloroflexi bacterium]|nr:response regulator [Chloroflexota bacterium]